MTNTLSKEQQGAYEAITKWFKNGGWCFKLGGYAGTGKTYLLQHLINNLQCEISCCAPTGKAAFVLQKKLKNTEVTTVHKQLYNPVDSEQRYLKTLLEKENPTEIEKETIISLKNKLKSNPVGFELKSNPLTQNKELVIVDESSMVSERMFNDLKNSSNKVLFVGDPGQLSPVKSNNNWFADFDCVLQQVQRQALDSPIIRLSMDIREGRVKRSDYQFENCKISNLHYNMSHYDLFDQIITGRNTTRQKINREMRKHLDYQDSFPEEEDKIICLKNEILSSDVSIINGGQGKVIGVNRTGNKLFLSIIYEGEEIGSQLCDPYFFLANYDNKLEPTPWHMRRDLREFDYAYAITCHKSQGSEWNNVLLVDDQMNRQNKTFRKQWLYTAVTRAKENLLWLI